MMAAVAVFLVLAVTVPTAAQAARQPFVGVVSDLSWGISPPRSNIDATVSRMAELEGLHGTRINMDWSQAEPNARGQLKESYLAEIDYAVGQVRAAGLDVLMPVADGVPFWASGHPNRRYRPANNADYASFVGRMVERYSAQGVHAYEVWNEPNHRDFWPSSYPPSPVEYTAMLAPAYQAIKQADPTAVVVMGGLSGSDWAYMAALYAAGAKPYFDVAAIHPYTGNVDPYTCWPETKPYSRDAFCAIESVRDVMVANGDSAKELWLTEFGWSSATPPDPYGVGEARQATYLADALDKVTSDYPYVKRAYWYNFRNTYWLNDENSWGAQLGLLRTNFTPKPAYYALKDWLWCNGPVGGGTCA